MAEITFTEGMICKEHVFQDGGTITKLSFKIDEFVQFLNNNNNDGWCNITVQKSKGGKLYGKLDTWKPNSQQQSNEQGGQQAPQGIYNQGTRYQGEHNQSQPSGNFPAMPNDTIDNDPKQDDIQF